MVNVFHIFSKLLNFNNFSPCLYFLLNVLQKFSIHILFNMVFQNDFTTFFNMNPSRKLCKLIIVSNFQIFQKIHNTSIQYFMVYSQTQYTVNFYLYNAWKVMNWLIVIILSFPFMPYLLQKMWSKIFITLFCNIWNTSGSQNLHNNSMCSFLVVYQQIF